MSCTVSELPSGCRLRGMSSSSQSAANAGGGSSGGGNGSGGGGVVGVIGAGVGGNSRNVISDANTGGIHIGGMLNTTNTMGTTTASGALADGATPLQRQQQQSQKPCCFCWCCCCSCSWAKW